MDLNQGLSLAIGVALGAASILLARRVRGESWMYAAALILLPLIYIGFAVLSGDGNAIRLESLFGAPFVLGGVLALLLRGGLTPIAVGALWILHAVFDISHNLLFLNSGVPVWYPIFCAAIDLAIGVYLVWPGRHEAEPTAVLTSDPSNRSPSGDNDVVTPKDERY